LTFDNAYETFLASHTGHGVLVRGAEAVRELAGRLVERELFLMEAETLGVPKEQAVLDIVEAYRGQVAADEFWRREVQDKVKVTDEDVEAFYAKTDVALKLTLIESDTREAAEALKKRVQGGEDMGQLARTESTHHSRNFDGALGYVRRGEIERVLEEPAFALSEPGSLTDVVKLDDGWAFVRLDERVVNPDRPPREKALPQIRGILIERAQKKLASEVDERILQDAEITIDEAKLTRENVLDGRDVDAIVARSAGETLSLAELREGLEIDKLRASPADTGADAGVLLAKQWARGRALVLAAKKQGLFEDPLVQRRVLTFRRDVIMKTLCDNYVWPDITPSDKDVEKYYEEHKENEFTSPLEVRVAYIVVATEDEAKAVQARIAAGEDFEKIARELSMDKSSAMHGGRIGWIKAGQLLPAVEERTFKLPIGGIDGPIVTPEGAFVVRVLDRNEPKVIPLDRARGTAVRSLVKQRQNEAYQTWAKALRERADVALDEKGVAQATEWLETEIGRRAAEAAKNPKPVGVEKPPQHDETMLPTGKKPQGEKP
jgi:parvulin-like peptidyl-prolyl isomerase